MSGKHNRPAAANLQVRESNQVHQEIQSHVSDLIRRGFYSMAFQPILSTDLKETFGFEALLRGPSGTPLSNARKLFHEKGFLDRNLLLQVDMACIGSAVRTGRPLVSKGLLFINAHGETLWHLTHDPQVFLALIQELEVPANRIIFEVSEATEKAHARLIARSLVPFRKIGIRIALDDIGVRHPWLHHLLWLEPEFIKVDRAFVRRVDSFAKSQRLLAGLVKLSEHAGARLIVEGVSTESEWQTVCKLGVPLAQGFWLGYPEPTEYFLQRDGDFEDFQPVPGFWKGTATSKERSHDFEESSGR